MAVTPERGKSSPSSKRLFIASRKPLMSRSGSQRVELIGSASRSVTGLKIEFDFHAPASVNRDRAPRTFNEYHDQVLNVIRRTVQKVRGCLFCRSMRWYRNGGKPAA